MVYESGFTTRRTYSSRPLVTSYSVSINKPTYPIYSSATYTRGCRVISSPVRVISPRRVVTRVIRSVSPARVFDAATTSLIPSRETILNYVPSYKSSYIPATYTYTYTPSVYYSSYVPSYYSTYTPYSYWSPSPSYCYNSSLGPYNLRSSSPISRISTPISKTFSYLSHTPSRYSVRSKTSTAFTEPFTTFREETGRIRNKAQSLMRDLHTPVYRRSRSCTPFPITGPTSELAFDAYVSRITNPVRHIAKEIHTMSMYPEPARKYIDAELDPNRPTRKFGATNNQDVNEEMDAEMKEKQRLRRERLSQLEEETDGGSGKVNGDDNEDHK